MTNIKNEFEKESLNAPNPEDQKRTVKQSEITGTIVIFDLTNSTALKTQRGFPGWVPDLKKFHEIISPIMLSIGGKWKKFLGDAYLYFFSDERCQAHIDITHAKPYDILEASIAIMNEFWNFYKVYQERERGCDKQKDFREITCAIDYGHEIIDWGKQIDDGGPFDPIGTPVDRCFRISGIAGPGQLLVSRQFHAMLSIDMQNNFEKIHIQKGSLKGFDTEDTIYYFKPSEEIIDYILSDKTVQLVEESKPMEVKAKLKLLHNCRKEIHPEKYTGGSHE